MIHSLNDVWMNSYISGNVSGWLFRKIGRDVRKFCLELLPGGESNRHLLKSCDDYGRGDGYLYIEEGMGGDNDYLNCIVRPSQDLIYI